MQGTAIAVSRRHSAFGCGHVAWGYSREEGGRTFYSFGSVEDPTGLPFAPPGLMAFWTATGGAGAMEAVIAQLQSYGYESFKAWPVPAADPGAADRTAERQGSRPYLVFTNNCLDSVHRVLSAYGVKHPHIHDPTRPGSWIPNRWFDQIPFQSRPLAELAGHLAPVPT